ncbi:hypothetical protein NDU88_001824 [Pleurodeles waltl]|uniref:Uncharacterized protein n=1 Tax=Pleurodeles waltl TaxID=8319 RepID=A0AAV7U7Y2_PLEWA|nr:hypothetical protein NDU88_001824 [Pleurodeles waltl]
MLAEPRCVQNGHHNLEVPSVSGESLELGGGQAEGTEEQEGPKKRKQISSRDSKKIVKIKVDGVGPTAQQEAAASTSRKSRPTEDFPLTYCPAKPGALL